MIYTNEDGSVSDAISLKAKENELNEWYEVGGKTIEGTGEEASSILMSQRVK